ncbi:MAG TPA: 3-isopropylmalate dehydrogenase, partial [Candidatus Blautia faecigallinarum]|nr:3-isopropylmalate dehydrogenase [Candidatus Blautia faecigallinarum]
MTLSIMKGEGKELIRKNLGQIFRKYNIIEYKSPEDYLSINDFYKVMSYACLYQAETEHVLEVSPDELTITMVCSHYPL